MPTAIIDYLPKVLWYPTREGVLSPKMAFVEYSFLHNKTLMLRALKPPL